MLISQKRAGDIESGDNSLLQVYPNPTDGIVRIMLSNEVQQIARFQRTDVAVKVLLERTASDVAINLTFDLSSYPVGNYILTVTQGLQTMSKVIVFGGK